MDQLQLPADVVGQLLLLLQDADIQCVRLVCKSWKQAVDHQLRTIRPLYLPPDTAAVFSNCNSLQGQLLRRVKLPGAIDAAATLPNRGFIWRAPLRHFHTLSGTAPHTTQLDLSGQCLPADCIAQLAQHFTRLGSLKLEKSTLLEAALCDLALFPAATAADAAAVGRDSGLHRLSLAGVQTCTEPQGSLAASAEHGPARLTDILDAIAANPLTHLNLDSWCSMAFPLPSIPVLGRCSHLAPLAPTLVSLKIMGNPICARDWQQTICAKLTLLTELHCTWVSDSPKLALDPEAFGSISRLQRLQSLGIDMQASRRLSYEAYTLAPLAHCLTALELRRASSLFLVLSLMECQRMQQLKLDSVSGVAGSPEVIVQVLRSMPLLRQLELCKVTAPQLQQLGLNHVGDYLLAQLDCCCPQLTSLVVSDLGFKGTGLKVVAAETPPTSLDLEAPSPPLQSGSPGSAAAATAGSSSHSGGLSGSSAAASSSQHRSSSDGVALASGAPGSGGLRQLHYLELDVGRAMSPALLQLSCLTGLHSLTLFNMRAEAFTHACRFDCFRFLSVLTSLTVLSITSDIPASRFLAATGQLANGLAGHPLQAADSDSDAEGDDDDGTDDDSGSDQSASDSSEGGYGSSSGSGSDDEWQEVDDAGDMPEAAAPQAPQDAGGPQQQGVQQQAGPAPPSARLPSMMEPHLHFLAGLKGLVSLNLGCLHTHGRCLMHLSNLTKLQSLRMSGLLFLDDHSLALLQHVKLPSVRHLHISGCYVDLDKDSSLLSLPQAALPHDPSTAEISRQRRQAYSVDVFVQVLCGSFANCEDLQLGVVDKLSLAGLAYLLQNLPKLQRLWMLGLHGASSRALQHLCKATTYVPPPFVASSSPPTGEQGQQQSQHAGILLPRPPRPCGPLRYQLRNMLDMAWFVANGVVVGREAQQGHLPEPQCPHAGQPAAAGAVAWDTAQLPPGALRLPCVVGGSLKYVQLASDLVFTRYMDRLVLVD